MATVEKLVAEKDRDMPELVAHTKRTTSSLKSAVQRLKAAGKIVTVRQGTKYLYRKASHHGETSQVSV